MYNCIGIERCFNNVHTGSGYFICMVQTNPNALSIRTSHQCALYLKVGPYYYVFCKVYNTNLHDRAMGTAQGSLSSDIDTLLYLTLLVNSTWVYRVPRTLL